MPIGSGLSAQVVIGDETTYGTPGALTRALEFTSESLALSKNIVQGQGLRAGGRFNRASRRAFTTRTVSGDVELDVPTAGAGLLFKHMLGSNAVPVITSAGATSYQQAHVPNGTTGTQGKSLTVQVGRPSADGVVRPFTFPGCKVAGWELTCEVGGILSVKLSLDAQDELTAPALATATYAGATGVFNFSQGALLLGGTVSTTGGVTSVTGATAVAAVKKASIKGGNPMATERFFFNGAGKKAEPIDNGFAEVTGNLGAEFTDPAVIRDRFAADTGFALQLTFTGPTISPGVQALLEVTLPRVFFDTGDPTATGPDVLEQSADFTALDDGTNPPIQLRYVSTDSAL